MGLFTRVPKTPDLLASNAVVPSGYGQYGGSRVDGIASSSPNNLQTIVLADILGDESWLPLSRAHAISVPAIAAARHLITGSISRQPLKAYKDGQAVATQPTWLYRTNGQIAPQTRLLWTLDDLIFSGYSLWYTVRGTDGAITDATRVPIERWNFNSKGEIVDANSDPYSSDQVILFIGNTGGLLNEGARTIRAARDLESTRAQRLRNPSHTTNIHLTDDNNLDEDEVALLQEKWVAARRSTNGAVTVTPPGVEIIESGTVPVDLLIDAQNAIAVNVAQLLGIPSAMIDAAIAAGSAANLTYQNLEGQRSAWLDGGFAFWASAITSRLSMDDCVPRGTSVDFDLSNLVSLPQPTTGPVRED